MDVARLEKSMKRIKTMWVKCPKCYEINYTAEVAKLNKCPRIECGHTYLYPFAKAIEFKKLLRAGTTWGEVGKFVLKALDSIKSRKKKVAFLSKTHGLILENFEWHQMKKKKAG